MRSGWRRPDAARTSGFSLPPAAAKAPERAALAAASKPRAAPGRPIECSHRGEVPAPRTASTTRRSISIAGAALWRLRRRGRGFWVISLDFTCVWTRRVGSGLEPEFGVGRVWG